MPVFSKKSELALRGVHPDLIRVMRLAIATSPLDFAITEGRRTVARQLDLYEAGHSRTLKSRHITGHAVDVAVLVGGQVKWDWSLYKKLSAVILKAAKELSIPIIWGGSWKTFKDGPHYELDRKFYP